MSKGAMRQVFVVFQTEWSSWELYAALPWTLDIPCWTLDITCWTLLAGHYLLDIPRHFTPAATPPPDPSEPL